MACPLLPCDDDPADEAPEALVIPLDEPADKLVIVFVNPPSELPMAAPNPLEINKVRRIWIIVRFKAVVDGYLAHKAPGA